MWSAARMTSGVVLHHHNGIAQLAQLFQNPDQPSRVAAVQADGRLVEHVTRAHQSRPQAGGKLDALRLAAGSVEASRSSVR